MLLGCDTGGGVGGGGGSGGGVGGGGVGGGGVGGGGGGACIWCSLSTLRFSVRMLGQLGEILGLQVTCQDAVLFKITVSMVSTIKTVVFS